MSITSTDTLGVQPTAIQTPWRLWACALALTALGTTLLYSASPGINWPISAVAFALCFFGFCTSRGKSTRPGIALPLVIACFIAVDSALTADGVYEVLVALVVLYALATAIVSAFHAPGSPMPSIFASPYAAFAVTRESYGRLSAVNDAVRQGHGGAKLRGLALALPVTLLLAGLLSAADPTFAAVREAIVSAFVDLSVVPRGIFFCVLGIGVLGALGIGLQGGTDRMQEVARASPTHEHFGDTERLIVTGSIAALFTVFLTLQVSYLFGNPGGRTGSGVSYADAVHRGFAELNIASSVCAVVLFALRRYATPVVRPRLISALEWAVLVQGQILLISAFYRVNLYEAAYGFTRLRLYVQAYAVVASVGLACLLLELRGPPVLDRLIRRVFTTAAVVFGVLILMNSDAWIANHNLQRYSHTGQLDIEYLTGELGPDAVPSIVNALPSLSAQLATEAADCLRDRYDDRQNRSQSHWFEWNLRRAALHRALARMDLSAAATSQSTCPKAQS